MPLTKPRLTLCAPKDGKASVCDGFDSDYSDYITGLYSVNLQQASNCASTPALTASSTETPGAGAGRNANGSAGAVIAVGVFL